MSDIVSIVKVLLMCLMLSYYGSRQGLMSISLLPSGMVSVCPREAVILVCETNSSSFLYWTVSVPHQATIPERVVANQGVITSPAFAISFTEFHVVRISETPLISQLLIDNVTTRINESNIYCSEDGDYENGAPMVTINVIGSFAKLLNPLNVDNIVVAYLSSNNISVLLLLLNPDGMLFNIVTIPPTSVTLTSSEFVQLTLLYNTLYNISIVPTLCGQTGTITLIQLEYINCGYPRLFDSSILLTNFSEPATQGMSVTFSCSEDSVLTGPNLATCMDNGQWVPDPREVRCKANCGPVVPPLNGYVMNYTSTLEDSNVTFVCEQNIDDQPYMLANCNTNGDWDPNPSEFCLATIGLNSSNTMTKEEPENLPLIILIPIVAAVFTIGIIIFLLTLGVFLIIKRVKKASEEDLNPQPIYEDITQNEILRLEANTAYGQFSPCDAGKNRRPVPITSW